MPVEEVKRLIAALREARAENARLRKVAEAAGAIINSGARILDGQGLVDMEALLALADAVNEWKDADNG